MAGRDVLARSRTGSGKTLAFAAPIVERITPDGRSPMALILVPTRELASQVTEEFPPRARRVHQTSEERFDVVAGSPRRRDRSGLRHAPTALRSPCRRGPQHPRPDAAGHARRAGQHHPAHHHPRLGLCDDRQDPGPAGHLRDAQPEGHVLRRTIARDEPVGAGAGGVGPAGRTWAAIATDGRAARLSAAPAERLAHSVLPDAGDGGAGEAGQDHVPARVVVGGR